MLGHHDFHGHFSGALHDGVKVIHLEPQQNSGSIGLVFTITDGTMMVFDFEPVQLKNKLVTPDELLIFGAAMIASAAQQALVPQEFRKAPGAGSCLS